MSSEIEHPSRARVLARSAAAAYGLWGAIHIWVGATVIARSAYDPGAALRFLNDARPASSPSQLPPGVTPLLQQHGWNLVWIGGFIATLAVVELGHGRPRAAALAFFLTGLADVGYLAAFVAPGFVKPATWVGGPILWLSGALLSWMAFRDHRPRRVAEPPVPRQGDAT